MRERKSGCIKWVRRFNEEKIKPFLIYQYNKEEAKEERNFYHNFVERGEKMGKLFEEE